MKYEIIKPYIEKKLISEGVHPENPDVRIFNYTQHCQFEGVWDEVTKQCRGLILNVVTGEVIARPFPKFFNYGEYIRKGWAIPTGPKLVTEKLDGSLGILYKLDGKPYIATRGSFVSEQAQWATKWWRDKIGMLPIDGETHLFEIIYPENRIVVNYDYSGLVHLCTLENKNGSQVPYYWGGSVRSVGYVETTDLETLSKMDNSNAEGFVVFYPVKNVRIKIKFPEYVRLHKIVTGVSEIGIWEQLREGKSLDELLDKVPDEFFDWVTKVRFNLEKQYAEIKTRCVNDFMRINHAGRSRKDIALDFRQDCKYPSILFAMLDNKPYEPIIWKMIRPSGRSQFKIDIDA